MSDTPCDPGDVAPAAPTERGPTDARTALLAELRADPRMQEIVAGLPPLPPRPTLADRFVEGHEETMALLTAAHADGTLQLTLDEGGTAPILDRLRAIRTQLAVTRLAAQPSPAPSAPPPAPVTTPPVPPLPEGPCEPFRFRCQGREIDLARAPLRHRLLVALWDAAAGRPHASRDTTDVMADIWPDDDEADAKLKDLTKQTRSDFQRADVPITIRTSAGKVWLEVSTESPSH